MDFSFCSLFTTFCLSLLLVPVICYQRKKASRSYKIHDCENPLFCVMTIGHTVKCDWSLPLTWHCHLIHCFYLWSNLVIVDRLIDWSQCFNQDWVRSLEPDHSIDQSVNQSIDLIIKQRRTISRPSNREQVTWIKQTNITRDQTINQPSKNSLWLSLTCVMDWMID